MLFLHHGLQGTFLLHVDIGGLLVPVYLLDNSGCLGLCVGVPG